DPTWKKKVVPRKREREEVLDKKEQSVQIAQYVGAQESGTNPSTYVQRNNYPIKENEKSPEEEVP
ncbi:hypothetical protein KI387_036773, partial [Taxus chinensis]